MQGTDHEIGNRLRHGASAYSGGGQDRPDLRHVCTYYDLRLPCQIPDHSVRAGFLGRPAAGHQPFMVNQSILT
jgi:hypothetical protein